MIYIFLVPPQFPLGVPDIISPCPHPHPHPHPASPSPQLPPKNLCSAVCVCVYSGCCIPCCGCYPSQPQAPSPTTLAAHCGCCSTWPPRACTVSHSLTHAHTRSLITLSLSLSHTHTHTFLSIFPSFLPRTHTLYFSHTQSHSHTLASSLSLSLSLSHSLTHSHTFSLDLTRYFLSFSLPPSLAPLSHTRTHSLFQSRSGLCGVHARTSSHDGEDVSYTRQSQ
jgi:hypothetical protein